MPIITLNGEEVSLTFEEYGLYPISVTYTIAGSEVTDTADYELDVSEFDGSITSDAFSQKPIIIPADCTGDITLSASIEDLDVPAHINKDQLSSEISAYLNITDIELAGSKEIIYVISEDTVTATIDGSSVTVTVSDSDLTNLGNIPAFYNSGLVSVEYNLYETDNASSDFDLKWDLYMDMPTTPEWIASNFATTSQIFKYLIQSDQSESKFPSATTGTTAYQQFNIGTWSEIPPFEFRWFLDSPATTVSINRAMLSPPRFYLKLTNNLSDAVSLSRAKVTFRFTFDPTDIFMNMRSEGERRQKQARIYTLPKGAEATRLEGLGFPIYAVVDGYKVATSERESEIIKVFASWNEYNEEGDYYFPTTIELFPVVGMGGDDDNPDFATCLYKSAAYPLKREDFIRITNGKWMNSDGINVLDAPTLAASDHYRCVDVKVKDDKSPDDPDAIFVITTSVNDGIDENITESDLITYIETLHFYDFATTFATQVEIPRSDISTAFRETLWQTYDKAPVLESVVEEPLYYVNFSINNFATLVPIYNGGSMKFSDSLSHAVDGIRSGDIFWMDGKTPNVINIQNPTKHKYKVKFKCDYEVYKDVYIMNSEDMGGV